MKIYQILQNFYLGETIEYPDNEEGIPFGYTRTAPTEVPEEFLNTPHYIKWSGIDWTYTSVAPPSVPEPPKIISKLGFLNRLGDDAYIAMLTASKTDIELEAWINKFNLMTSIDLNDSKIQQWIAKFVSKNILTQENADKLIQDPLQPSE